MGKRTNVNMVIWYWKKHLEKGEGDGQGERRPKKSSINIVTITDHKLVAAQPLSEVICKDYNV
jgi:hypothetical protein